MFLNGNESSNISSSSDHLLVVTASKQNCGKTVSLYTKLFENKGRLWQSRANKQTDGRTGKARNAVLSRERSRNRQYKRENILLPHSKTRQHNTKS